VPWRRATERSDPSQGRQARRPALAVTSSRHGVAAYAGKIYFQYRPAVSNPPPTGLASFLFTDVAGSTRLWEEDADAMATSLRNHDQILRSAIETNRGYVFSTAGDAFAAAFPTAEAAVAAALAAQLELRAADWPGPAIQVRMGIHTGSAEERGGDYFGPVLNRAARIMSAGNGGQLLISSVTADLLSDRAPESHRLEGPRVDELDGYRTTLEAELGDGLAVLAEGGGQMGDDEAVAMFLEWAKSPTST
jgi:class 3 adenylate cyclase